MNGKACKKGYNPCPMCSFCIHYSPDVPSPVCGECMKNGNKPDCSTCRYEE